MKISKMNMLNRINAYLSVILIVIGLVLVLITLYSKPSDVSKITDIGRLLYSFFELLGFTLFTSGIFTIFLQFPDWQNYFEERLRHIVLEQDYLNSLDSESLSNLQVKTLKAYFHTSDIDKEGSFLNYFQENINQYISLPYRDDVKTEINVLKEDESGFEISDRIIYNCRMVGGKIQEFVKWRPEEGEYSEIKNVIIRLKRNKSEFQEVLSLNREKDTYKIKKLNTDPSSISFKDIYLHGLVFNLNDFTEDGLVVEVKSNYKVEKGRFSTWAMAHPTRNFCITIHYPDSCDIHFLTLLPNPDKIIISNEKGLYTMLYKEWLLPNSGVAYSFISSKKEKIS